MTATTCESWRSDYTGRARLALADLERAPAVGRWSQRDLETLGQWLLPEATLSGLSPETALLIAPHRRLHGLPWSALVAGRQPLVAYCIPVVVPSLHSLALLWQHPTAGRLAIENGLLLAVSDFQERHSSLPQTIQEVEALSQLYPGGLILRNEAASWAALQELAAGKGLATFSFLHVASHAFHDNVTGRLSGLALSDRDVWLDELWDCAPLPGLVTLSACSGSKSRLYEGDEHIGLATTCLAAGARHVVASLWPVLDEDAAGLMIAFYNHLAAGQGVAKALALAQRAAWQTGKAPLHWAGFRCTGLP
ncbi:MAG: CHAT domain-containing protein [Chloroflexi bacterium]|nr:CHAT domain-containing protein [Chloroflexota bacterium]MCI0577697.1 CHAT domain-containing protein [Chloroflexota bacterium]MCI0645731.1 CHAT domain-containing protein [Chloroflexota bacterium]MCI0728233.1 CHAT domain-containing protein [Chloroflexota bacterium]